MDTTLSGTTIYEEHQSFWLLNIIALIVASGLILTAYFTGAPIRAMGPAELIPLLMALAIMGFVLWGFSRLNSTVTTTDFRFGFPIWHRRVAVDRIVVGDVVRIPIMYGIGLHLVGGQWVYNAKLGRGVQVVINGRRYLIGSDNPEQLQAALMQVAPRRNSA